MVAQTTPDHVESQKARYGKSEISTENPDFELNFEFAIFQKKSRYKRGRSLCGSDLFWKMKSINKQSF